MKVFRKIEYFINVYVSRRTLTSIQRPIFRLRQRRKMDTAYDLRTVLAETVTKHVLRQR